MVWENEWKKRYKEQAEARKNRKPKKAKTWKTMGLFARERGDKLNFGIFHVDNPEKLLGWIRKYAVTDDNVRK